MEEKHSPEQGRAPLFVVGMWRSGTSLFYALLNQHPQIKLMYEDELPLLWPLFLGRHARRDWPERWEFWNQAISRHKLDVNDLPRDVRGLREACEATWNLYAPEAEIRGGKSPSYFDCLPRIAEAFPDAKFLVMWRDPADVCRSVVRARNDSFFAKRGMVLRALLGCRELKAGYDALFAKGVSVYPVQYEDLVENPAAVMQGVCRFLEIDFDPRMVTLKGADRSAIYEGGHHGGVNSEKIVAAKKAEVLPEGIRHKVNCYIAHWKKESGGTWPQHPAAAEPISSGAAFFVERTLDRALYRSLRTFDQFVALVYSYLPIGVLRKYRASRERPVSDSRARKPIAEKELVGASKH
ncbi:MAG TPA: sulfotransferase [Candidatus Solibacter sp.]|nr:sulfotransferase [Candidatus Solibacter sp.]